MEHNSELERLSTPEALAWLGSRHGGLGKHGLGDIWHHWPDLRIQNTFIEIAIQQSGRRRSRTTPPGFCRRWEDHGALVVPSARQLQAPSSPQPQALGGISDNLADGGPFLAHWTPGFSVMWEDRSTLTVPSMPQPQAPSVTQFGVDGICDNLVDGGPFIAHWTVDGRQLWSNINVIVSPPLVTSEGSTFKLMIHTKKPSSENALTRKRPRGTDCEVCLKCESGELQAGLVMFSIVVGQNAEQMQPACQMGFHNFANHPVAWASPQSHPTWDLLSIAERNSDLFVVALEMRKIVMMSSSSSSGGFV